jgi:hypothetical protein
VVSKVSAEANSRAELPRLKRPFEGGPWLQRGIMPSLVALEALV